MTYLFTFSKIADLTLLCDECNNNLVLNTSNLVCCNCGLIHDPILSQEGEQINEIDNLKLKHEGLADLSTKIYHVFSYLELPYKTRVRTIYLIRKNYKKQKLGVTQLAIASLIQATKEQKILIPYTKIVDTFKEFHMKINRQSTNISRRKLNYTTRLTVKDYLKQYLSLLHENIPELEYKAKTCFELAKLKRKYQGHSPRSFAGAIISIVYRDQKVSYKTISETFKVSYTTIRENRNIILKELGL